MTSVDTIVVLAKRPAPGRVKTRLTPPLTPSQAAALAAAALSDTLAAVASAPARHRALCFDGASDGWLRAGWSHRSQCHGGLDARLADAFASGRGPTLVVGMDTPQLDATSFSFDAERFDACLGPAEDGGYWAIGLRDPSIARAALSGVTMSASTTFDEQLHRLHTIGLTVQALEPMRDVDTISDASAVAAHAPHTSFAATFARLTAEVA
jgi:glycosyltransferase A (GT-A) superfamily protein (DUF2064 family)